MNKIYHFLVPELVPLENKGEEAIVRGIGDVIFPDGNYEIHLFDEVEQYRFVNGIHVYPVKWFISPWLNREFGFGITSEKIRDSTQSLIRNGLHLIYPGWVKFKDNTLLKTVFDLKKIKVNAELDSKYSGLENLLKLDYIIAGHDGAMDERVCHVIEEINRIIPLPLGIFGIEFPLKFKSKHIVSEQYRVLREAKFFFCRTNASKKVVDENFPSVKSTVRPDPAFGMKPASSSDVDNYLQSKGLLSLFEKPVILCTTCETGPISRFCFANEASPGQRLYAHRKFYAKLVSHMLSKYDVNVLFLPHALGPGQALDDTYVAAEVIKLIDKPNNVHLLHDDISAKLLKAIIAKGSFLIAERIHSMIGAVGVGTPFLCLGSSTDRRVEGIISEMVGAKDSIYYMNNPDISEAIEKLDCLWGNRSLEEKRLNEVFSEIVTAHALVATEIKEKLGVTER
ncbi:MAG: polysaccharide pyruvyl transferase family protein [Pseudomonas sp.]|nr:polysaccharide pyruvyl transferase family protein [Pseudomonas sp.]